MARRFLNNTKQTSSTSGLSDYELTGTLSGFDSFDQLNNGDVTVYGVRDQSYPNTWEICYGTYTFGPPETLTRNVIASSTGLKIDWPAGGDREIVAGLPGEWMEDILLQWEERGLLSRVDDHSWSFIQFDDGTHLTWINPDGSGNISIDETNLNARFARKDIAVTFAQEVDFNDSTNPFNIRQFGGGGVAIVGGQTGEALFLITRLDANDHKLAIIEQAVARDVVTIAAPTSGDATRLIQATGTRRTGMGDKLASAGGTANSGKPLIVNSAGDGFEPAGFNIPFRAKKRYDGTNVAYSDSGGTQTFSEITLTLPGPIPNGTSRQWRVRAVVHLDSMDGAVDHHFQIRCGAAGTTADTSLVNVVLAGQGTEAYCYLPGGLVYDTGAWNYLEPDIYTSIDASVEIQDSPGFGLLTSSQYTLADFLNGVVVTPPTSSDVLVSVSWFISGSNGTVQFMAGSFIEAEYLGETTIVT